MTIFVIDRIHFPFNSTSIHNFIISDELIISQSFVTTIYDGGSIEKLDGIKCFFSFTPTCMCRLYIYRPCFVYNLVIVSGKGGRRRSFCVRWMENSKWEEMGGNWVYSSFRSPQHDKKKKTATTTTTTASCSSYREGEVLLFFFFPSQPEDDAVALLTAPSTSRVKTNKTTRASEVTHRPGRSARSAAASISTNAAALGKLK